MNLTKPAPGRTGGQTARNPLGSTPSRNLDGLPNASFPPSDATNGMEPDDGGCVGACSDVLRDEHEIGTGVPGLPESDDWTTWDAGQMRAAVEYLEHLRGR